MYFQSLDCSVAKVTSVLAEIVMGRTPFYRTSKELEHHFSNIERRRMCSSIGHRTGTPIFWLWTIEHRTLNLIRISLDLLNYSLNRLEHQFFEHWTNWNVFIYWLSNSNTVFLASNDRTLNFEHCSNPSLENSHFWLNVGKTKVSLSGNIIVQDLELNLWKLLKFLLTSITSKKERKETL